MPALSSLIVYRPGKKARAAIKAPFSLLRGESSTASSTKTTTSHQRSTPTEVLDINHPRFPSDIDAGNPPAPLKQDVCRNPELLSSQHSLSASPQVGLDIDLSSNAFSDWFDAFNGPDAKREVYRNRLTPTKNSFSPKGLMEGASEEEEDLDTSYLGTHNEAWPKLKRSHSMAVPEGSSPNNRQASRPPDLFIGTRTPRPLSSQSDTSSALSGTTIARALMSNSFILSSDRTSMYRSGAGLTRSDSTTLPRWSRNSSMMLSNDRFSVGLDPLPPIPSNAELLYEPPRKLRNEAKRSSTDSLSPKMPSGSPSICNDPPPLASQSSLPHTPARLTMELTTPPSKGANLVDAQLLSPDSDTLSSPPSSGHTSPQELEGLLNYYSLPDSPELLVAGFKPMFSPISEETLSQLSSPFPRNDRRDSQLMGTRSQTRDSTVLPMKEPADLLPQILFPVGAGAQHNIPPASTPAAMSSSSFYFNGNDNPDARRSRSASSSTNAVRNSRDMDVYNFTMASSFGDASVEGPMVSQEFPETPNPFSPMFSARPNAPSTPANDGESSSIYTLPTVPELPPPPPPKRSSVDHSEQGSLNKIRTTLSSNPGSPSNPITDISESPEEIPLTLSPTADASTEASEPSANHSNISPSMDASRHPNGPDIGQDPSNPSTSLVTMDSISKSRIKDLPSIPMSSPSSPCDEPPPISLPGTSTTPIGLAETTVARPSSVKPSRGRLPPAALTISRHSGPDEPLAVNGTDQGAQSSELEPQNESPGSLAFSTQSLLAYRNETFRGRASDIFRGTSLGSPPPYYSLVNEEDIQTPHFPGPPFSFSPSQGSDGVAGSSSGESTLNGDSSRNLGRENSYGQRTRIRPPLPAGPRRPSQQLSNSPFPQRGSFSSVASCSVVPDSRNGAATRTPNLVSFQPPTPKWKGYKLEVAKWTFTSAQLQAIVARAIRKSAEASSIRLLRLEVIDDEIPEEIQRLQTQRTNIKTRYVALTRRRAMILDSLYSSLSSPEDVHSAHRPVRQLDELKELTQGLDRLAEEIHSVDQQLGHLESLVHVHTGSALALALRKLNSSFLKQAAENQVLRNQIQSLEAERDEGWHQAQSVANEYDQLSDKSTSTRSSRVYAKRKSCIRVSRAGLRTPNLQHSPAGIGASTSSAVRSPPPPLPRRPTDISTDSPQRSSAVLSSEVTPTSESRALARAQDELYALLGITNPEQRVHRSRSLSNTGSPHRFLSPRSAESPRSRRRRSSSLPGASSSSSSLPEAYNVMADGSDSLLTLHPFQRNAILATIDMLSATE